MGKLKNTTVLLNDGGLLFDLKRNAFTILVHLVSHKRMK